MHAGQPQQCHWETRSQIFWEAGGVGKLHPWRLSEHIWLTPGCGQLGLMPRCALVAAGGRGRDPRGPSWVGWC